MNRVEFIKELETLLECISEEERKEALEYYESYFEDAGKEKEAEVIRELQSPKKVAESIKAGLRGEDRAIYTERGYEEEKQQSEQHENSFKKQLPSSGKISLEKDNMAQERFKQEEKNWYSDGEGYQQGYADQYQENNQQWNTNQYQNKENEKKKKHGIIISIAIITSPVWICILIAILCAMIGVLSGMIGFAAGIFSAAIGLLIAGIAAVLDGFVVLTGIVSLGLLEIGIGLLCISGGGILLWGSLLFITKAIPGLLKWVKKQWKKIFQKKGACKA